MIPGRRAISTRLGESIRKNFGEKHSQKGSPCNSEGVNQTVLDLMVNVGPTSKKNREIILKPAFYRIMIYVGFHLIPVGWSLKNSFYN